MNSSRIRYSFLVLFTLLCFRAELVLAAALPELQGYVNDYAGMISAGARSQIEAELRAFEQSDSTQVVILTVPSLEGEALEDFSIKVAEAWKVGQKHKDNGIIFLVSRQDRKLRIEVGRGLEGRLTDLMAGRIIDLVVKPRFKRGDYDGGFTAGVSALIDATRGEFKADGPQGRHKTEKKAPFLTLMIFALVVMLFLGSFSKVLGGLAGAIGLPALVSLSLVPVGLITGIILAVVGLIIGMVLPRLFSSSGHGGGGFWPGGGYYGGGGGSFGGGGGDFGGGGGFDGGGGGDFGGGGASGDW